MWPFDLNTDLVHGLHLNFVFFYQFTLQKGRRGRGWVKAGGTPWTSRRRFVEGVPFRDKLPQTLTFTPMADIRMTH